MRNADIPAKPGAGSASSSAGTDSATVCAGSLLFPQRDRCRPGPWNRHASVRRDRVAHTNRPGNCVAAQLTGEGIGVRRRAGIDAARTAVRPAHVDGASRRGEVVHVCGRVQVVGPCTRPGDVGAGHSDVLDAGREIVRRVRVHRYRRHGEGPYVVGPVGAVADGPRRHDHPSNSGFARHSAAVGTMKIAATSTPPSHPRPLGSRTFHTSMPMAICAV